MTPLLPTRRDLIKSVPLILGASALPRKVWAQPAADRLRLFVIGDWGRRGTRYQKWVAQAMTAKAPPRYVLSTGDNFYGKGVASVDDDHWRESFHDIYRPEERESEWYAVLGNHDWGGNVQAQIDRSKQDRRWNMPSHYYELGVADHQVPDVDIFMIDTTLWIGHESFPHGWRGDSPSAAESDLQKQWLERELDRSTAPMKLVVGHHPIYSVGAHGGFRKLDTLDDLLRKTGVSAYICGHDHGMYHIEHDGMQYICSGAGSEILPDYSGGRIPGCVLRTSCGGADEPKWLNFLGASWRPEYDLKGGFAIFEVTASWGQFWFVDGYGTERYTNIVKPRAKAALAV